MKNVLIIQYAKLGDLVATTPMFRAIKNKYPDAEVHVLCRKECSIALQNNPYVDTVYHYNPSSRFLLIVKLYRVRFDWCINTFPSAFLSSIGLWALIPNRVGAPSHRHGIFVKVLSFCNQYGNEYTKGMHTFDHYMMQLAPLGIDPVDYALDFFPSTQQKSSVKMWMQKNSLTEKSYVVLNPSAGNVIKEWPVKLYAELADRIVDEYGLSIVISTLDKERVQHIKNNAKHGNVFSDASSLSLGEVACLYGASAAYVSGDTGPLYVAYAMGASVVIILGPVHPHEQTPQASNNVAPVNAPEGIEPWLFVSETTRIATEDQLKAVRDIPVSKVFAALKTVISS